jgi:hypothetical protein
MAEVLLRYTDSSPLLVLSKPLTIILVPQTTSQAGLIYSVPEKNSADLDDISGHVENLGLGFYKCRGTLYTRRCQ